MEADPPSFLYPVNNGLGHSEHPSCGSLGGQVVPEYGYVARGSRLYSETVGQVTFVDGASYTSNEAGVWRWHDHFQNDFAARLR